MPKSSKPKRVKAAIVPGSRKGPVVPPAFRERFTQWLCSPDNVCEPYEERSFTENPEWRIFRIMSEFIEGFEFLSKLKNEVTIFGSARTKPSEPHYKVARQLGFLLGSNGYTTITGGGPGIMEAANRGAFEAGGPSVGLDIELPQEQRRNKYVKQAVGFHYFFSRKVMLSASAQAYVFFPGGFGTLDEMSEMLTLIQTEKLPRVVPLILVDKTFWQPLLDWIRNTVVKKHGYVSKDEFEIIQLVDTAEEAFEIIKTTVERRFG